MRGYPVYIALFACLLVAGCSSKIQVNMDYDPEFDFSGYSNWAWHDQVRAENEIIEERFRGAIENALLANGYPKAESAETADFLVSFTAVAQSAIRADSVSVGMGYRRRGTSLGVSSRSHIREYTKGTLIIDIIEPTEKILVWRGVTAQSLNLKRSPEDKTRLVREVVAAVLEKFPPGSNAME